MPGSVFDEDFSPLRALQPGHVRAVLLLAIQLLEAGPDKEQISAFVNSAEPPMEAESVYLMAQLLAGLFWECAKGAAKDPTAIISAVLQQAGIISPLLEALTEAFRENQLKFTSIKKRLLVSHRRYVNLTWRIDVEVARRNMNKVVEPRYLLRVDVDESTLPSSKASVRSYNLQADYANLKKMQLELQRAVDEQGGAHSQRVQKYLS